MSSDSGKRGWQGCVGRFVYGIVNIVVGACHRSQCPYREPWLRAALCALFFPLLLIGCIPDSGTPPVPTTAADLASLEISAGALSPAFSGAVDKYNVAVSSTITSTMVKASPAQSDASLQINNQPATAGQSFGPIPLANGANPISIVVTPRGSDPKSYLVTVVRGANADLSALSFSAGPLLPGFTPAGVDYTVSVPNSAAQTTITATVAQPGSTITVDGAAVPSGQPFGPRPLNVGANTFTILVRGADGISSKTYSVVVTRAASSNANLAALQVSPGLIAPAFNPAVVAYNVTGTGLFTANVVVLATAQDAAATLSINGQAAQSGRALAVPIGIGVTIIPVVVRAQDTVTVQAYTIRVTRP